MGTCFCNALLSTSTISCSRTIPHAFCQNPARPAQQFNILATSQFFGTTASRIPIYVFRPSSRIVYTENCHASSQVSGLLAHIHPRLTLTFGLGYEIVSAIRNVAHRFGPVKHFKAYLEVPGSDGPRSLNLRSELQSSGVSLTDCPHNGRKNVADQMIMGAWCPR
jgi:hypothetical protein